MTKAEAIAKYSEAAHADRGLKEGTYVRSDNFRPIADKLRHAFYDKADIVEVGHNLISVEWVEERGKEKVQRKQVFYVQ